MPDEGREDPKRPSIFKATAGSIKTLRQSYKDRLKIPEKYSFQGELAGESDRASIILMSSMLEDAIAIPIADVIAERLKFRPTEADLDHILRFEGPLGTFSRRLEIASMFGIIEEATFEQLDIMRELRNACAHSKQPISFSDATLVNVVRRLFEPLGFLPQPEAQSQDIKSAFIVEGTFLLYTLLEGSREKGKSVVLKNLLRAGKAAEDLRAQTPSPDK